MATRDEYGDKPRIPKKVPSRLSQRGKTASLKYPGPTTSIVRSAVEGRTVGSGHPDRDKLDFKGATGTPAEFRVANPTGADRAPKEGKVVGAPNKVERAGDLARLADIERRQAEEEARRKERSGKRPSVGMGPAQGTTGGGLGMLKQDDVSKPKKLKMGGVMKKRGGTFKGVF